MIIIIIINVLFYVDIFTWIEISTSNFLCTICKSPISFDNNTSFRYLNSRSNNLYTTNICLHICTQLMYLLHLKFKFNAYQIFGFVWLWTKNFILYALIILDCIGSLQQSELSFVILLYSAWTLSDETS